MNTPAILYRSQIPSIANAVGAPRQRFLLPPQCPIQLTNPATDAYSFDQDFEIQLDYFPVASKNTAANAKSGANWIFGLADSNAILTAFTEPTPGLARTGKFVASFSRVPATWFDTQEASYTFPAFPGNLGQNDARNARALVVTHRLKYEYFVVDPANVLGSGVTVGGAPTAAATVLDSGGTKVQCVFRREDIPIINKSEFYVVFNGATQFADVTTQLVPTGGKTVGSLTFFPTMPDLATYQSWMATASAVVSANPPGGWASAAWNGVDKSQGAAVGQLVAQDSRTLDYAGNIVARVTAYVLAR